MGTRLTPAYPVFDVKNVLLHHVILNNGKVIEQLLVPQTHRFTVQQLAHTLLLGAHSRVEKTKEIVLLSFFWLDIHKEVDNDCHSCPD